MNGYDFDKTIFKGDSFIKFYVYTLVRRPFLILLVPFYSILPILFLVKVIGKKEVKEALMLNLLFYRNREELVEKFWDKNQKNIQNWYLIQKKEDDIIISASPSFLLKPILKHLNITTLIATQLNLKTLKIEGNNCYGEEKARRFETEFGTDCKLEAFYSDSLSDLPMMYKSKKGILVKGSQLQTIYEEV